MSKLDKAEINDREKGEKRGQLYFLEYWDMVFCNNMKLLYNLDWRKYDYAN